MFNLSCVCFGYYMFTKIWEPKINTLNLIIIVINTTISTSTSYNTDSVIIIIKYKLYIFENKVM